MTVADTADGPAFFVGFGVLILMAPFLFLVPLSPLSIGMKVLAMLGVAGVMTVLCMWLLPAVKGVFLNLQIEHAAVEARFGDHLSDKQD